MRATADTTHNRIFIYPEMYILYGCTAGAARATWSIAVGIGDCLIHAGMQHVHRYIYRSRC